MADQGSVLVLLSIVLRRPDFHSQGKVPTRPYLPHASPCVGGIRGVQGRESHRPYAHLEVSRDKRIHGTELRP
jgi:hypothetical protein